LLDELQGAEAADNLNTLVPGPAGGDPGGLDVAARPVGELHYEGGVVVVLDLAARG
jgi:hypothetical protein